MQPHSIYTNVTLRQARVGAFAHRSREQDQEAVDEVAKPAEEASNEAPARVIVKAADGA